MLQELQRIIHIIESDQKVSVHVMITI